MCELNVERMIERDDQTPRRDSAGLGLFLNGIGLTYNFGKQANVIFSNVSVSSRLLISVARARLEDSDDESADLHSYTGLDAVVPIGTSNMYDDAFVICRNVHGGANHRFFVCF